MDELLNDAKLETADDDVTPATQLKGKIIKFTWYDVTIIFPLPWFLYF